MFLNLVKVVWLSCLLGSQVFAYQNYVPIGCLVSGRVKSGEVDYGDVTVPETPAPATPAPATPAPSTPAPSTSAPTTTPTSTPSPQSNYAPVTNGQCPTGALLLEFGVFSKRLVIPFEGLCAVKTIVVSGVIETSDATLIPFDNSIGSPCSDTAGVAITSFVKIIKIPPAPITYYPPYPIPRYIILDQDQCVTYMIAFSGLFTDTGGVLATPTGDSCPSDQILLKPGVVLASTHKALETSQCATRGNVSLGVVYVTGERVPLTNSYVCSKGLIVGYKSILLLDDPRTTGNKPSYPYPSYSPYVRNNQQPDYRYQYPPINYKRPINREYPEYNRRKSNFQPFKPIDSKLGQHIDQLIESKLNNKFKKDY